MTFLNIFCPMIPNAPAPGPAPREPYSGPALQQSLLAAAAASSENAVAPDYEEKKKKRTGDHGYGLKILEDTAEKYGGRLVTDDKGDTFTVVMTMRAAADSPKN